MEIQVGEYIRTKKGIIDKVRKKGTNRFNNITGRSCYVLCEKIFCDEIDIVKHSFNIIDLIEVGDYVNGELIDFISISKEGIKRPLIRDNIYFFDKYNGIKSIVTKEQFESIKYEV